MDAEIPEPVSAIRTTSGPRPIHPAIRKVWLWSNVGVCLLMAAMTGLPEYLIESETLGWKFPVFMPLLWLVICLWSAYVIPRRWERWRYEVTEFEVILQWGVWWQTQRFVPRDRIQHVDITSGPIARKFGLAHVHLFVAGAHGSVGAIPGLTPAEAEELRGMLVDMQAEHV